MAATLEVESTLTDRYQTTVPESVRRVLKLGKRDKIHYSIHPGGEVVLRRAARPGEDDPVLAGFLAFLASDIAAHPERLQALDVGLVKRLRYLVGGLEVDLDAPLADDDENDQSLARTLDHQWLDDFCSPAVSGAARGP